MKRLEDILYKVRITSINGNRDIEIASITTDSRSVEDHSLFIAIKGEKFDGHLFIEQALNAGASEVFPVGEEHGWRLGRLADPYGYHWEIGHQLKG